MDERNEADQKEAKRLNAVLAPLKAEADKLDKEGEGAGRGDGEAGQGPGGPGQGGEGAGEAGQGRSVPPAWREARQKKKAAEAKVRELMEKKETGGVAAAVGVAAVPAGRVAGGPAGSADRKPGEAFALP